eukprot:TRINITY_DN4584_c0_g2_i5.p1 TRINITY_DN4584_c0_g2~~TRINITY_DN4584_c0_g2_i5.p1  ORF type:complete len:392 (-),score=152.88 TRINITY_DN4584_c0_g2_i5:834-2009(-)
MLRSLVGSEMCIRDRYQRRVHGDLFRAEMKKFVALLLVAAFIASAGATLLRGKMKLEDRLQGMGNNDFGQTVLQMISLQTEMGGDVEDVLKLMYDLKASLETEQNTDQAEYDKQSASLIQRIFDAEQAASNAITQVNEASSRLKEMRSRREVLEKLIVKNNLQLNRTIEQRTKLVENHEQEAQELIERMKQAKELIEVLTLIINDLTHKVLLNNEPTLAEVQQIADRLHEVAKSNPLASLVQFTATLDVYVIKNIITKLEDIRIRLALTLKDDKKESEKAETLYQDMIKKLQEIEQNLSAELLSASAELKQIDVDEVTEEERKENNLELFRNNQVLQAASQVELDTATAAHKKRSDDRSAAIKLLNRAIKTIKNKKDRLIEATEKPEQDSP